MKQKILVLSSLLAAICGASAPQVASAHSVKFILDNSPSPAGSIPWPQTVNNVCVYVAHDGHFGWQQIGCRALNTIGAHEYCLQNVSAPEINQVKISINGNDAFWLDKWDAYWYTVTDNCTGPTFLHEQNNGINNNVGYCFSTDSSDYSEAACTAWGTAGKTGSGPSYSAMWWDWI